MLRSTRKNDLVIGAVACLFVLGFLAARASAGRGDDHQDGHKTVHPKSNNHKGRRGFGHQRHHHSRSGVNRYAYHDRHQGRRDSDRSHWGFSRPSRDVNVDRNRHQGRRDSDRSHWGSRPSRNVDVYHSRRRGSGVRIALRCDSCPRYEIHRRWVSGHYETRTEEVYTGSEYYETRTIKVWVPGCWVTCKVLVPHRHGPDCSVRVGIRF